MDCPHKWSESEETAVDRVGVDEQRQTGMRAFAVIHTEHKCENGCGGILMKRKYFAVDQVQEKVKRLDDQDSPLYDIPEEKYIKYLRKRTEYIDNSKIRVDLGDIELQLEPFEEESYTRGEES